MSNLYKEFKNKCSAEVNSFPMMFAFSKEQFAEGMKKLGLEPTDTNKIYSMGNGGYYKKTDAEAFRSMLDSHNAELKNSIEADTTGEGFILDMFKYELNNHEYCYTGSVTDTLDALCLTREEVDNNEALKQGLKKAKSICSNEDNEDY